MLTARPAPIDPSSASSLYRAARMLDAGDPDGAWSVLAARLVMKPDVDHALAFWRLARQERRRQTALPLLLPALLRELECGDGRTALELIEEIVENCGHVPLDFDGLLVLAEALLQADSRALALSLLEQAAGISTCTLPGPAIRLARLAAELDPVLASVVARRALRAQSSLGGGLRRELESFVILESDETTTTCTLTIPIVIASGNAG